MSALIVEITKEGDKLKVSAYERSKSAEHTLRHYIESNIPFNKIHELCDEITTLLNKATRSNFQQDNLSDELRKIGQLLFDQLFPSEVKTKIRSTESKFLILSIDELLVQIPWELLHDGSSFLSVKFALGRVVRTRQKFNQNKLRGVGSPVRMLILADPTGDLDSAYREGVSIRNELEKKVKAIKIHLKTTDVDSQFLKKNIRDFDLVHFAGHAEYNLSDPSKSGWLLKDEKFTSKDILALGESGQFPMVVFSNACQSGMTKEWSIDGNFEGKIYGLANAFLLSGVKHYIGTFWQILDEPSAYFSKHFYQSVLQDMPMGEALRLARLKLIEKYGDTSIVWASYMLYGDPSVSLSSYYSSFESKLTKRSKLFRNKYVIAGVLLLAILGIRLSWISTQHTPLLSKMISEIPKNSLAVMPFTNLNKDADSDWLSVGLAGGVSSKIYGSKDISLVDRQLIENKQKEMKESPNQGLDLTTADKISRMFGANWMVLGDYQKVGDQLRVSIRLINLTSGQEIATTQSDGTLSDLFKIQDKIAFFVIEKINSKVSEDDKKRISALTSSDNVSAYEYMFKAVTAANENNYEKATEYCDKALSVDPNYFEALSGRGFLEERLGNKETAKEFYSKALKIALNKGDKLKIMNAYFTLGNFDLRFLEAVESIESLTKALNISRALHDSRSESNILNSLSRAYLGNNDYSKALQCAQKSESIARGFQDQSLMALLNMTYGFIYSYGNNPDNAKALDHFTKALNSYKLQNNKTGQSLAYQQITRLKVQNRDYDEAINLAGNIILLGQQMGDAAGEANGYQLIAAIYQAKSEIGKAIEYYEKSLVINMKNNYWPGSKSNLWALAMMHMLQTNYDESLKNSSLLTEEARKRSDYEALPSGLEQQADAYKYMGRYSEALDKYKEAISFLDKSTNPFLKLKVHQGLGEVFGHVGNTAESEANYKKAIELAKATGNQGVQAEAINQFARYHEDRNDNSEAIRLYNQAITLIEKLPAIQVNENTLVTSCYGIAQAYLNDGNEKMANQYLDKALTLAEKIHSPLVANIKYSKSNSKIDRELKDEGIQNKEAKSFYDSALHRTIEGKSDEAIDLLTKALNLNGPNEMILSGLCLQYQRVGKFAEALKTSGELIEFLKKKNKTEQLIEQYCWQAHLEFKMLNYDEAIRVFDKAEKLALDVNYKRGLVLVYADSGEVYESIGDSEKAIDRANKAIEISNEIHDPKYVGNAYQTLSSVYTEKGNNEKAIEFAKLDLERAETTGFGDFGRTYAQAARAYKKVDVLKSIDYLNKAVDYFESVHDEQAKGNMFNELGTIYQDARQNDKALDYYLKSAEIAEKYNDKWTASAAYIGLLSLYNDMGKKLLAEEYENKFIQNVNITHDQDKSGIFIGVLGDSKLKVDPVKASEYFKKSNQVLIAYSKDKAIKKRISFNYIGLATIEMDRNDLEKAEANILLANKAIEDVKDKEFQMLKAFSLNLLAQNLAKDKKFEKARLYFSQILDILKTDDDNKAQAATYFQLGVMDGYLKNFESSISMFNTALDLANKTDDDELKQNIITEKERWEKYRNDVAKYEKEANKSEDEKIADELVGKAVIYTSQKKYKAAVLNLKQALQIYTTNGSKNGQIWAIGLMMTLDLLQNRIQDAELNYQKYTSLANELKDKEFMGLSHGAKALILEKKKDYRGAENELKEAIDILKDDVKTKKYEPLFYTYMGSLRFKQGDRKQAIVFYEKSLTAEKRYIEPKTISFANFMLGYFYFKENSVSKAVDHLKMAMQAADEIDENYLKVLSSTLMAIIDKSGSGAYLEQANRSMEGLDDADLSAYLARHSKAGLQSSEAGQEFDILVEKLDIYYRYEAI